MKYYEATAGEWIEPIKRGYKMGCCDCGLVHTINFRIVDGQVQMQLFRDRRATAACRRGRKTKGK